eukprot:gene38458-46741_t
MENKEGDHKHAEDLHPHIGELTHNAGPHQCSICAKPDPEFECWPCRCNVFCKKCAMKLATGGKCKNCKAMFTTMSHIGVPPEIEQEDVDAEPEKEQG